MNEQLLKAKISPMPTGLCGLGRRKICKRKAMSAGHRSGRNGSRHAYKGLIVNLGDPLVTAKIAVVVGENPTTNS